MTLDMQIGLQRRWEFSSLTLSRHYLGYWSTSVWHCALLLLFIVHDAIVIYTHLQLVIIAVTDVIHKVSCSASWVAYTLSASLLSNFLKSSEAFCDSVT